jgi:NAD(P)-dependent dehydrogenase (short-subunit alcohol dehydrogenase family)
MDKPQSASKADLAVIRSAFEPNFFGMIQTTVTFLPLLRSGASPSTPSVILNVSTDMASNGFMASPKGFAHNVVAYNTSKAAANSYTIALAHELKDADIKVNCATPGFTTTKLNGFAPGGKTAEQGAEMLVEWCLMYKDGKTGEIRFLC